MLLGAIFIAPIAHTYNINHYYWRVSGWFLAPTGQPHRTNQFSILLRLFPPPPSSSHQRVIERDGCDGDDGGGRGVSTSFGTPTCDVVEK